MWRVALCLFLSGCLVDAMDGHIDDPDSCCIHYPSRTRVDSCVRRFLHEAECSSAVCGFDDAPHWVCFSAKDEDTATDLLGPP